ncbi:hypothetical protein ACFSL3_11670, partial [Vibrio thalassae]
PSGDGVSEVWRLCALLCRAAASFNKAFKSDSQRLAFSLRSSIAKRRSHLNAALAVMELAILKVIE